MILVNANNYQRSKKPPEDGVDTVVGLVSSLPRPPLLVGMGNLLMARGQHTLGCQRGMVWPVHAPMIIKHQLSRLMLHKLVVTKGSITTPQKRELPQPHITPLHYPLTAATLVLSCSLNTTHTCNPHTKLL